MSDICLYSRKARGRRCLWATCVIIAALAAYPRTVSCAVAPLDTALRTVESAADFSDYLTVAASTYAEDIDKAVELGLVVGKYDRTSTYYDPETLITTGEMVNILARNLGATSSTQGEAAATYLGDLGVKVSDRLDSVLSVAEMESLATQSATVPMSSRANLVVVREALSGTLSATQGGVTRAFAVAMYSTTVGEGLPQMPPTAVVQPPGSGESKSKPLKTDGLPVLPAFVLTD